MGGWLEVDLDQSENWMTRPKFWLKPKPRLFSRPKFLKKKPRFFSKTKVSESETETFFRRPNFSKPILKPSNNWQKSQSERGNGKWWQGMFSFWYGKRKADNGVKWISAVLIWKREFFRLCNLSWWWQLSFLVPTEGRPCPFPARSLHYVEIYEIYNHTIASFDLVKWFARGNTLIFINWMCIMVQTNSVKTRHIAFVL